MPLYDLAGGQKYETSLKIWDFYFSLNKTEKKLNKQRNNMT